MSNPNVLQDDTEIIERYWEMYVLWCENHGVASTFDGFMPWYEEKYL